MKKTLIALLLVIAAGTLVFANGNAEKSTTMQGTAVIAPDAAGHESLMLQLRDGSLVQVGITNAELAQLQVQNQDRLTVKGVYIGTTEATKTQSRIMARTMTVNNNPVTVKNPVQLTKQDRDQIRACEQEQSALQTRTKDQTQTSTGAGAGSGAGSGSGSGGGSGSGAGGNK